jgi:AbrB family looped-hinge helix DNA binding protein
MTELKKTHYKVEEIFTDIPGDPDNVMMKIPDEIMEKMGWKEGDNIKVENNKDGSISIKKIDK